jgi:hypothetical protein
VAGRARPLPLLVPVVAWVGAWYRVCLLVLRSLGLGGCPVAVASLGFASLFCFPCRLALGAVLVGFLCLRSLGFVMSFSSFVSSLPVLGAVAPAVRPSLAASVPRGSLSAPVSVVAVALSGADAVSVVCSDGRVRVCRVSYASRALGRPVSRDAVFARLAARVGGSPVRFVAAFGYSADSWFVAVEAV